MNTLNGDSNGNANFKMKTAEFRGYTLKALEDISKDISELKDEMKGVNVRVEKINSKLSALKGKMAGIGAVAGIIASAVIHFLII